MKTKIKRHSRSVISVILAVCMIISCMTVGIIATDAAKVDRDSAVGDGETTYYLWTSTSGGSEGNYTCQGAMTYSEGAYTASIPINNYINVYFFINTSNETKSTGFINYSDLTISKNGSLNDVSSQTFWMENANYYSYRTSRTDSSVTSIDLSFNGTNALTVSAGTSSGGGGSGAGTDYTVSAVSNDRALGTVVASTAAAYEGQTVTVECVENTGDYTSFTIVNGEGTDVTSIVSGAYSNHTITFTMPAYPVTVNVTFTLYSTTSNFYYNNYGSNGQPAATYYGAQMTEAKLNGETYSYYHVTGRTEDNQLFTVSYGSPKYNSYNTYFQFPKIWGGTAEVQFYTTDGKNLGNYTNMTADGEENGKLKWKYPIPDGAREVQFKHGSDYSGKLNFASGNNAWYVESAMNQVSGWNSSNPVPTNFYENFHGTNKYTNAFKTLGFYNHGASRGENHDYTKPKGLDNTTKGDYYIVVLYENKTYTINGETKKITNNPEIIWMPTLPTAGEDTTETVDIYAKNGTLRDSTFNRFTNLADTDFDTAYFEYTESLDSGVVTYNSIADYNAVHSKKITYDNAVSGYNSNYAIMKNVPIGAKIKIKTTLSNDGTKAGSFNNTAFKDTHYLKAYSFNGMSYQVNTPNSEGVYEEIWTVRDVNTKSADGSTNLTKAGKSIEVTPIYYMKDNTNCKTFYIDGYDGTVQNAWGNLLCVYPYYENKSNSANAFGGYPGQPMLFWGGKYQMEIPLTVDGTASGASVKGLTLHNSYWDLLHRSLDIRCNARNHAQTYDYDDFYKLYKEKNPDTIIFDFKYRTAEDNYNDGYQYENYTFANSTTKHASDYTGSGHNGVEIVTDYFGRQVDAFGNLIADANKSHYGEDNGSGGTVGQTNEILFVSTGYKDTYVGEYATIWAVYQSNGTFIGYISSSMLYLNNIDRRLQYTGGDSTASGRMSWSNFISTYNTLKSSYTGVPALIVYDREIWNDSKDKAYRSDGKWYYSNKSDKISANIKIQYGAYSLFEAPDHSVSSDAWRDDPFNENKTGVGGYNNIGTNTGCSAYFTNTTPNLNGKVASGEQFADSTKKFTFQAVPYGSYMFAGWVRYSNGKYYEITENEIGESPMSSNDVYIARFVTAKTGSLTVQHVVEQTNEYNGTGTPALTVTVKDGSGNNVSGSPFSVSDGSKIDISKWIDARNATYTIDIRLTTTPTNESYMKEIVSSSGKFAATPASWTGESQTSATNATVAQFTVQEILDSGVTSLRYVSHLQKPTYTYQYEITYTYTSRFWGEQSYTQTGTCEDGDFTGSKRTAKLTTDFIIGKTPYEKSFRQQINWNYTTTAVSAASGTGNVGANAMENNVATDQGSNTYKMTAHVYASKTVNDKVTAEFVLPYKYNEKAQGYTVKDTDVYNSNGTKSGTSYLYDSGNESVTLSTKAYSLFTYDDEYHTGSDNVKASSLSLMEAAPYLMMDGSTEQTKIQYHYKLTDNIRYYTGNSFKVGDTTYYLDTRPDDADDDGKYVIMNSHNPTGAPSVEFLKVKHNKEGDMQKTTYHYAVADTTDGQEGDYGYKIYFFSYVTDDFGNYVDNEGRSVNSPIFNGQYCVYSVGREKDGMIEGTGVKKYFTRWDIYNTKGDYVASCYNRRFNFSGYDNYIVKPVYASDTEQTYASSTQNNISASITYLDDSRNQWKGTGASGNYNSVTGQTDLYAGDKIFTDFAITYNYNGLNLNLVPNADNNGANIKVGMIVERLDELDSVGTTKITGATYYADKYKSDNSWNAIKTALEDNSSLTTAVRNAGGTGHSCYHERIASNCSAANYQATLGGIPATGSTTSLMGFDTAVDNFNRLQWFYTINNSTQSTSDETTATVTEMKNYAYRAISYIMVGNTAYLCSTPTYFTIYDTATRTGN